MPGEQRQPGRGAHQRPLDLGAGRVAAGVDDPVAGVPALPGAGEPRRPSASKIAPRARSRATAAGPSAGSPRRPPRRTGPPPAARVSATCAATLSPGTSPTTTATPPCAQRVVPASGRVLGQHHHPHAEPRRRQRGGQPRHPGADDDHVGLQPPQPFTRRRPALPISIIRCTAPRGRGRRSRGRRAPRRAPSRRQRSSFAGVIIFMYLQDARSLTARKSTSGAARRNWCSMPTSVATSTSRADVRPRGVEHAAGGQDLHPLGRARRPRRPGTAPRWRSRIRGGRTARRRGGRRPARRARRR